MRSAFLGQPDLKLHARARSQVQRCSCMTRKHRNRITMSIKNEDVHAVVEEVGTSPQIATQHDQTTQIMAQQQQAMAQIAQAMDRMT